MTKIACIHLSDIHIKENSSDNHILKKVNKIFEASRGMLLDKVKTIIVVTGDIAYAGTTKEYDLAFDFFTELMGKIESYVGVKPLIVFIPGNHDCDFSADQTIRNLTIESVKNSWYKNINDAVIDLCTTVQSNYDSFISRFDYSDLIKIKTHKLLNIYNYEYQGKNIVFNCFNTSWISKIHEEEGHMAFPVEYFPDDTFSLKSDITINLIHHPINWQNNVHHRSLRTLLEDTGDLILSGHEHLTNQREVTEKGGQTTVYVESGALQTTIPTESAFNLYVFDLDSETYDYNEFKLSEGHYKLNNALEARKYDHRYNLSKKEYSLDLKFAEFINSTDAQFAHPSTDQLLLSDIYTNLNLHEFSLDEKESLSTPKYRNTKDLIPVKGEIIKWGIIGSESSGKTALLKILINRLFESDFVPIYIKGEDLKDITVDKINKFIKSQYFQQYNKKCHSKYDQIDRQSLTLIIDNIQNCNVQDKFRIKLFESLKQISDNLILSANAMIMFEPIKDEKSETTSNPFNDFTTFNIMEMSALIRYELIDKWNKIGKDYFDIEEKDKVFQSNENFNAQIKATLGLNYIPNYPFYVLTLLSSLSNGKQNNDYSLSGYYYESLITNALDRTVNDKDSLQFYNQFLAEFFYFLFENKLKNLQWASFTKFFDEYCKKYQITEDMQKVLRELCAAKILKNDNATITFTYRYVYYFFIAKFFATNISDPFYRDQLSKMCKRLYREEFSNVIIFLTHLSKDPFIINEIYTNSKNQFHNISITEFGDDIVPINKLVDDIPALVLDSSQVEENRVQKYLSQVEDEEIEKEFEQYRHNLDYDINEDITSINFLNQIIGAIKTYELLGQITKKYWGSIDGKNKYDFAKETFDLALRTLNTYFQYILEFKTGIVDALRIIAVKKKIDNLTTMKELTNAYIFKLCCMVSQGSIQRVSNSIGHKKLRETFENIVSNHPNNAYRLIDVAIKLDHDGFPDKEIHELINDKKFTKNFLPKFLLQSLVYNHSSLYSTSIKEKQFYHDKLQIKIEDQRRTDFSSVVKK